MAEYKHGRVFVTRYDTEGLTREIWVFERHPRNLHNDIRPIIRLRAYLRGNRPTRRHKFRGLATDCWSVWDRGVDAAEALPRERVPLPDEVLAEAIGLVRALVSFADVD